MSEKNIEVEKSFDGWKKKNLGDIDAERMRFWGDEPFTAEHLQDAAAHWCPNQENVEIQARDSNMDRSCAFHYGFLDEVLALGFDPELPEFECHAIEKYPQDIGGVVLIMYGRFK